MHKDSHNKFYLEVYILERNICSIQILLNHYHIDFDFLQKKRRLFCVGQIQSQLTEG